MSSGSRFHSLTSRYTIPKVVRSRVCAGKNPFTFPSLLDGSLGGVPSCPRDERERDGVLDKTYQPWDFLFFFLVDFFRDSKIWDGM